jgi:hypothetical protein
VSGGPGDAGGSGEQPVARVRSQSDSVWVTVRSVSRSCQVRTTFTLLLFMSVVIP